MSQSNLNVKITAQDQTGEAFRTLNDSLGDVGQGARSATSQVSKLASASGVVTRALAVGGGIAVAAVAAAVAVDRLADSWAKSTIALNTQAGMLGISIGRLDALGGAAELAGSSAEALGSGLMTLQKNMYDVAGGRNGGLASMMQMFGIHGGNAADVLPQVAAAMQRVSDPMNKAAIATEFFGSSASDLMPFLLRGKDGIEMLTKASKSLGVETAMSAEEAVKFMYSQVGLERSFRHLERTLIMDVAPSLSVFLDYLKDNIQSVAPALDKWAHTGGPQRLAADVRSAAQAFDHFVGRVSDAFDAVSKFNAYLHGDKNEDGGLGVRLSPYELMVGSAEDKFSIPHARSKGGLLNPDPDLALLLNAATKKYNIDPYLVRSLVSAESGGKFGPSSDPNSTAYGYFQINDPTAKTLGINNHDYAQNVDGGVRYLQQMLGLTGGNRLAAVAAYHDGPNSSGMKWFKSHPGDTSHFSSAALEEAGRVESNYASERKAMGLSVSQSGGVGGGNPVTARLIIESHLPPGVTIRMLDAEARGDVTLLPPKVARTSTGRPHR